MIKTLTSATPDTLADLGKDMELRETTEIFILFPMGSQFDHLIMQMMAKLGVFCIAADPASVTSGDVRKINPIGIILSGGPGSVVDEPPPFDLSILDLEIPILGICLGFQLWAKHIGATVRHADKGEFNGHPLQKIDPESPLFKNCAEGAVVLESHGDMILPYYLIHTNASTEHAPVAAGENGHLFGVQFHPEVSDTKCGEQIFRNFCFTICGAKDVFPATSVTDRKVAALRQELGGKKVLLALSGGSDSSVVAYLLKCAAISANITIKAVYVRGIDRPDDEMHVMRYFAGLPWLTVSVIDGTARFLSALAGKTEMHEKRLAVREAYKAILEEEIVRLKADCIAQGTLYTDLSESGVGYVSGARKARIKLHHNVDLGFSVPEVMPLADQVKDTARNIGRSIGVPEELLVRHPFPGPGLVVRISGEVTPVKLKIARQADGILLEELHRTGYYSKVWQAGAVVTDELHTCSKGDDAMQGLVVVWWAVNSVNGFTAQAADLPYDFRQRICRRTEDEIREVGAVAYRDSGKPSATIEWG